MHDASKDYRRLVATLASRARRMGSRDPEGAAQEALKRSLATPVPRAAIHYYFRDQAPVGLAVPDWPVEQLFAWLHGVLRFVVREESARVSARRELLASNPDALEMRDPSPDQLHILIDDEMRAMVRDCLAALDEEYRSVLTLRAEGLKYAEIASRLGVNENTVATWVRRGTKAVAEQLRERMDRRPRAAAVSVPRE